MNTEALVKLAAAEGAKAAMRHINENKRQAKDRRLYNTRLLLGNYMLLYDHCQKSITDMRNKKIKEDPLMILSDLDGAERGISIEAIKQSTVRTYVIVKHVDEMLELFKFFCAKTKNTRKYNVVVKYYFEGKTLEEIAEDLALETGGKVPTTRTIQRDLRFSIEKLSALIFGIDGLASCR